MNKEPIALQICQTLHQNGYLAYYAGGYVRDQLLKIPCDDIDIATDAAPEVIQKLFPKTIPLGIAFGIVVVVLEGHSYEVATFRKDLKYKDGRRPDEVAFSSPEEDAKRRDFTINGMFYDPIKKKIIDYVGGKEDLEDQIVRAIGDPFLRFEEDKLRMVRACRFAARLGFTIDSHTKQAILAESSSLFPSVSIERITQEFKKMKAHHFSKALLFLFDFNLLKEIFPVLENLTRERLEFNLQSFDFIPKEAPMVAYLLELLVDLSCDKQMEILEFLKLSNEEINFASFCLQFRERMKTSFSLLDWVQFYADPRSELCLNVIGARFSKERKKKFIEENQSRALKLKAHIERKQANKPLVTSNHLMKHGISAGKKLGELLKKAEEITVDHDFDTPEDTIEVLKTLEIWKTR